MHSVGSASRPQQTSLCATSETRAIRLVGSSDFAACRVNPGVYWPVPGSVCLPLTLKNFRSISSMRKGRHGSQIRNRDRAYGPLATVCAAVLPVAALGRNKAGRAPPPMSGIGTSRSRWPPAGRSAYWGSSAFLWCSACLSRSAGK